MMLHNRHSEPHPRRSATKRNVVGWLIRVARNNPITTRAYGERCADAKRDAEYRGSPDPFPQPNQILAWNERS